MSENACLQVRSIMAEVPEVSQVLRARGSVRYVGLHNHHPTKVRIQFHSEPLTPVLEPYYVSWRRITKKRGI